MLVYWEGLVCQHSEWHCVFGVMVFFVIVQLPTFQILLARTKVHVLGFHDGGFTKWTVRLIYLSFFQHVFQYAYGCRMWPCHDYSVKQWSYREGTNYLGL